MKQKYVMIKEKDTGNLLIQEYEMLDKNIFSLVCEVKYDQADIISGISEDRRKLILLLRSQDFFPVALYVDKIADSVIELYSDAACERKELILEDKDFIVKVKKPVILEAIKDDTDVKEETDVEDILGDEPEDSE